jgi:hypothetical protein
VEGLESFRTVSPLSGKEREKRNALFNRCQPDTEKPPVEGGCSDGLRVLEEPTMSIAADPVLIESLGETPIVYRPSLARALGGIPEAILASYLMAACDVSASGRARLTPEVVSESTGIDSVALPLVRTSLRVLGVVEESRLTGGYVGFTVNRGVIAALVAEEHQERAIPSKSPLSPLNSPKIQSATGQKSGTTSVSPHVVPDGFQPTDRTIEIVVGYPFVSESDVAVERLKFVNHHQAKGTKYIDWQAAFRNWMLNVSTWRVEKAGNSVPDDMKPRIVRGDGDTERMSPERRRQLAAQTERNARLSDNR